MRRKKPDSIDLDFRPRSYWGSFEAIVATVRGEMRRRRLLERLRSSHPGRLEEILLVSELPAEVLGVLHAIDPELTAGEHFPPVQRGEAEIARMLVRWPTPTVFSARARVIPMRLGFTVVGEDERTFTLPMSHRPGCMSTREVLDMFCGMRETHAPPSARSCLEDILLACRREAPAPGGLARFVELDSLFYPRLQEAFAERIQGWAIGAKLVAATEGVKSSPTVAGLGETPG
jgi:hypothetical protein